jgi:hypothetical protein
MEEMKNIIKDFSTKNPECRYEVVFYHLLLRQLSEPQFGGDKKLKINTLWDYLLRMTAGVDLI